MDLERIPFRNARVVGANIDSDAYHRQLPHIERGNPEFVMSRSELMLFASCPSRWFRGFVQKDNEATDYGSLIDCLLMDRARFDERFALQPKTVIATKTMKCVKDGEAEVGASVPWSGNCAEAQSWTKAQKGKIVVTPEEDADVHRAISRLFGHERAKLLFECSDFQVMVVGEYLDKATGLVVPVKALLDLVPRNGTPHERELGDFKSARSAHPRAWVKAIDERNYDAQAALFLDLYVAATDEDRNTFLHVVQESLFPFEPDCRMLSEDFLRLGRMKVFGALQDYCQCLAANQWPSWSMQRIGGWGLTEPDAWMAGRYTEPLNLVEPAAKPTREPSDDITP